MNPAAVTARSRGLSLARRGPFPASLAATVLGVAVLLIAGYWGLWRLSFASEDFLILGALTRLSLGEVFLNGLTAPWLEMSFVNFYRPVSTFLLALAVRVVGLEATALHMGLLLLHGVSSVGVASIVRRLTGSRAVALATVAVYAVSPLHPSAVAFLGGYATVLGGLFSLATLAAYLRHRDTGERWAYGVALGAFVLALGAYEAAVVLPAALLVLVVGPRAETRSRAAGWKTELLRAAPFLILSAGYLLLRRAVLGVFVGGYGAFQDRFLSELPRLAGELLRSLPRMVLPRFHPPIPDGPAFALGVALALGVVVFFLLRRRADSPAGRLARASLCGLLWAGILLAPFSFVGVVPATGRFWYLASFAETMAVFALAWGLLGNWRGRLRLPGRALWWALALVALVNGFLGLRGDLRHYFEADREVNEIREALAAWPAVSPRQPLLVAGVPAFARAPSGVPVAKIFQYGLQDSVRPPFARGGPSPRIYPVPPDVHPSRIPPAARAVEGEALRWNRQLSRLQPLPTSDDPGGRPLQQIERGELSAEGAELTFRCAGCAGVRLFLLTPGAPYRSEGQEVGPAGEGAVPWPRAFLESMARHYEGEVLGWLEGRDRAGRLEAASEVFTLPLAAFRGKG